MWHPVNGVIKTEPINNSDISVFTLKPNQRRKIFLYDQEPFIPKLATQYINKYLKNPIQSVLTTSEFSNDVNSCCKKNNFYQLYYFFHGFAALDWFRGHYALNFNKPSNIQCKYDFISYNRLLLDDRSYRLYFISLLNEAKLLKNNLVSYGVTDTTSDEWVSELSNPNTKLSVHAIEHIATYAPKTKIIIDNAYVQGSASADIPRTIPGYWPNNDQPNVDAFWHIVTETVFYYDKLHLTEKIFKPIVSKQPFMLLAAPGNLEYLRSYGFKTFSDVIDESYDNIQDNDLRTEAVVKQLQWYCNLSTSKKQEIINKISPIVEYNFQHFYGMFKHIITSELLNNCKSLFKEIGYDDSTIAYDDIYRVVTT